MNRDDMPARIDERRTAIRDLMRVDPALAQPLDATLACTGAEVLWAVRQEMARSVEDVLARRCRALFLNAAAAVRMAPRVAALVARELGRDEAWEQRQVADFTKLARRYTLC